MKRTRKALIAVCIFLSACESGGQNMRQTGWPEELVIVQMANEDTPNAIAKKESLIEHLKNELDIEVTEYRDANFAVSIEALRSKQVDVTVVSPMGYYQAKEKADAEFLVTPVADEKKANHTAFYTQADRDDINSIEDLRGTNFAFVNLASTSGYLYPKGMLVQAFGLDPDLIEQSGYFFENVIFSESHQNSLMGVALGDFDAAAIHYSEYFDIMVESLSIDPKELKYIGRTVDIPEPTYVIRGDLPEDFKEKVTQAFISFEDEDYFETILGEESTRFMETPDDYYDDALEMLEVINVPEEE